jgi:hypothetical protein
LNNLDAIQYNRENLKELLTLLSEGKNEFSNPDFSKWCWTYWSKWREGLDNLFETTDETTINIINDVYTCYLADQATEFMQEKIISWLNLLK